MTDKITDLEATIGTALDGLSDWQDSEEKRAAIAALAELVEIARAQQKVVDIVRNPGYLVADLDAALATTGEGEKG